MGARSPERSAVKEGALQISVVHFEVSQQHFRNAGGFGVVVALAGVQPALSRSMQRLETALQVSLFDRQKNKIELNDNGRMAVEYAGRIVGPDRRRSAGHGGAHSGL